MRKNETFTGIAEGYTYDGAGVVKTDGFVFFVPGLIAGEEAELSVTAMKKTYGYARIVRILKKSPHRVQPGCSSYRLCGGCQIMHMDHEEQKRFKEDKVRGCFLQNADMDITPLPILYSEEQTNYRNKVQVPVQLEKGKVLMGFYQNHTNRIIESDSCLVQTELSNRVTKRLKQWLSDLKCANVFRHVLIRHAHNSGQLMICMIVREYPFYNSDRLVDKLRSEFPEAISILAIVNRRSDNVILDGKEYVLYGKQYIEEQLLGCTFRISARSFYQINPTATEILYRKAIEYAQLTGNETVIDLYCGTGTIGILASRHARQVYGIEIVEDAVKDAELNAEINHADNIEFFAADANAGAQILIRRNIRPDVVIVDPPRKGCSKDTLNAIIKMSPERLVYVSCDPATLARDCAYMRQNGYDVRDIQPTDMFPGTVHVETVCLLYHQKKDFISVPYEPKNADYLKKNSLE